jgi:nucleoside-diphosphate-sugar epimerase
VSFKVLVVGGTGLISTGIVKALLGRGAAVTVFNRGRSGKELPAGVDCIIGDRSDAAAFERTFERARFDVVIDMICFTPDDARSTIRAFGGRCEQLQLCSTVCTYGAKIPPGVLIDESFQQEPVTQYGRDKVQCERLCAEAAAGGAFALTVLRPSHTYGPGGPLIDQLEFDASAWDRIVRGLPVLCAGDGLGLWQSTHRDDCGTFFAYAARNPKTYGEAYNVTRSEALTWRDYYRVAARALDRRATLVFVPAEWLFRKRPDRFGFLREITQFHGAYSSAKAMAHVPEFRAEIGLEAGARETFADMRRRGAFRDSKKDDEYQSLVDETLAFGVAPVKA